MIRVEQLSKTFGRFPALDGLNMHVPRGAIYGLVGPNGAGKSTLLRHITGVLRPDCGSVLIDGQPAYENPAVKQRYAYIPDEIFYFSSANLLEMAKFYAGIYPHFSMELYRRLRAAFALDERLALRRYSKGMQKQAAFLLSIAARPELLILDEPVDGLDPVMRRQVWGLIMQDVAERQATVLVSSHNLRELEDVCDHVGIMHHGKMLLERALSELQDNVVKVQVVFRGENDLPPELKLLHESRSGRIRTLIIRGTQSAISHALDCANPIFYDLVPLTLEEVFVYELGGADYDVKSILL